MGFSDASLSIVTNTTGFLFSPVSKLMLLGPYTGQLLIESHFVPNSVAGSFWAFESFDPAFVHPNVIPEVSSLWMLGMGLSGLGVFSRRKFWV